MNNYHGWIIHITRVFFILFGKSPGPGARFTLFQWTNAEICLMKVITLVRTRWREWVYWWWWVGYNIYTQSWADFYTRWKATAGILTLSYFQSCYCFNGYTCIISYVWCMLTYNTQTYFEHTANMREHQLWCLQFLIINSRWSSCDASSRDASSCDASGDLLLLMKLLITCNLPLRFRWLAGHLFTSPLD